MTRSRKIFLFFVMIFVGFLVFTVIDISRRTTFPGSKRAVNEDSATQKDSIKGDSSAKSAAHPR